MLTGRPWWNGPDTASLQKLAIMWVLAVAVGIMNGPESIEWAFLPMLAVAGVSGLAEVARALDHRLTRSKIIAGIQIAVFLIGLAGLTMLGLATLQARADKALRERQAKEERVMQEQRAKEEADNRAKATAEECARQYAENVARLTKRRDRTGSEAKRCKETAPKGFLVSKTPEEHCRDKIAAANSATYELRLAEQKTCPGAPTNTP